MRPATSTALDELALVAEPIVSMFGSRLGSRLSRGIAVQTSRSIRVAPTRSCTASLARSLANAPGGPPL